MRLTHVASAVGAMLRLFSFTLLVPAVAAFVYEPWDTDLFGILVPANALTFVASFLLINAVMLPVKFATLGAEEEDMSEPEGFLTAAIGWLLMPLFGMVPFLATGVFHSPLDAYFEATSGLTTTGFTVLPVPADEVAPSLNLWRGLTQWVGGIGIVILSLALISRLTHGGMRLFQAESSVHAAKRLRPKLVDTARTLLVLYTALSLLLFAILLAAMLRNGMPWKDAVLDGLIHMMAAFATGGFSSHAASVSYFDDALIEGVLMLTMVLGATNFHILIALRHGDWRTVGRDPEWRFFLAMLAIMTAVVVGALVVSGMGPARALRHGAFATVSLLTTTGFNTIDWSTWPLVTLFLLLLAMFMGGTSGSTAGAIKAFRVLLLGKLLQRQLRKLVHPRAVLPVRVGSRVVSEEAIGTAAAFIFTYVLLWVAGSLAIAIAQPGLDALEAASASAASLGNVGNAFGAFGPAGSVASMGVATKVIMTALMWFGRLEIFTALLLFSPQSWRS